jgi:hypothetical protein
MFSQRWLLSPLVPAPRGQVDANHDGSIDWDEFKRAVSKPTTLEAWAQSVPLWQARPATPPHVHARHACHRKHCQRIQSFSYHFRVFT